MAETHCFVYCISNLYPIQKRFAVNNTSHSVPGTFPSFILFTVFPKKKLCTKLYDAHHFWVRFALHLKFHVSLVRTMHRWSALVNTTL